LKSRHPKLHRSSYYNDAVDFLIGSLGNIRAVVVAERQGDLQLCPIAERPRLDIQFCSTQDPLEDFCLLVRSRHQIIANSSFSWWAAMLNTNEEKIVVAPRYWKRLKGGRGFICAADGIVPESWVVLDNTESRYW